MDSLEGREEKVLISCGNSQEREGEEGRVWREPMGGSEEIVGSPIGFCVFVVGMAEVQEVC